MYKYSLHAVALASAMLIAQCAVAQDAAPMSQEAAAMAASAPRDPALKPVFDQFGGKPGLVTLMNDFMDNLLADARTHAYFAEAERDHIKAELVDQFCVILDGPCTYTGKNMEKVHRNLGINRAAFNALVEDLQSAMDKNNVPFRAQNKLLAKLASMHPAVITK